MISMVDKITEVVKSVVTKTVKDEALIYPNVSVITTKNSNNITVTGKGRITYMAIADDSYHIKVGSIDDVDLPNNMYLTSTSLTTVEFTKNITFAGDTGTYNQDVLVQLAD